MTAKEPIQPPEPQSAPYGYCPHCGAKGKMRERRIDGNDVCENGHTYNSNYAKLYKKPESPPVPKGDLSRINTDISFEDVVHYINEASCSQMPALLQCIVSNCLDKNVFVDQLGIVRSVSRMVELHNFSKAVEHFTSPTEKV